MLNAKVCSACGDCANANVGACKIAVKYDLPHKTVDSHLRLCGTCVTQLKQGKVTHTTVPQCNNTPNNRTAEELTVIGLNVNNLLKVNPLSVDIPATANRALDTALGAIFSNVKRSPGLFHLPVNKNTFRYLFVCHARFQTAYMISYGIEQKKTEFVAVIAALDNESERFASLALRTNLSAQSENIRNAMTQHNSAFKMFVQSYIPGTATIVDPYINSTNTLLAIFGADAVRAGNTYTQAIIAALGASKNSTQDIFAAHMHKISQAAIRVGQIMDVAVHLGSATATAAAASKIGAADTSDFDDPEDTIGADASDLDDPEDTIGADASDFDDPEDTIGADASDFDDPEDTIGADASDFDDPEDSTVASMIGAHVQYSTNPLIKHFEKKWFLIPKLTSLIAHHAWAEVVFIVAEQINASRPTVYAALLQEVSKFTELLTPFLLYDNHDILAQMTTAMREHHTALHALRNTESSNDTMLKTQYINSTKVIFNLFALAFGMSSNSSVLENLAAAHATTIIDVLVHVRTLGMILDNPFFNLANKARQAALATASALSTMLEHANFNTLFKFERMSFNTAASDTPVTPGKNRTAAPDTYVVPGKNRLRRHRRRRTIGQPLDASSWQLNHVRWFTAYAETQLFHMQSNGSTDKLKTDLDSVVALFLVINPDMKKTKIIRISNITEPLVTRYILVVKAYWKNAPLDTAQKMYQNGLARMLASFSTLSRHQLAAISLSKTYSQAIFDALDYTRTLDALDYTRTLNGGQTATNVNHVIRSEATKIGELLDDIFSQ